MSYLFSCEEPWTMDGNKILYKGKVIAEVYGEDDEEREANQRIMTASSEMYKRLLHFCFVMACVRCADQYKEPEAAYKLIKELLSDATDIRNFLRSLSGTLVDYHYNECFGSEECDEKNG